MKTQHPSNMLYLGHVTDFTQAMNLFIAQCEYEKEIEHRYRRRARGWEQRDEDLASEYLRFLDAQIERAENALRIYRQIIQTAESEAIATLREEGYDDFADALDRRTYSQLAI